ncbi:class I SAM-dependent methyltransferase [Candidatus Nomurabacteria bacterium]|nr:class I SAM-dependent methyltransferase [Candidatus Nomurabacteria bacterium]
MQKFSYQNTIDVYNTLGKKYLADSLKIIPPQRDFFISLLPKGAHILDVGCGGGRDAKYFIKKGFKVTGIDMSSVLINIAKKEVPKASFKEMDILKLDFPINSFDAV